MAHVFRAHIAWSGSANGPTLDPATVERAHDGCFIANSVTAAVRLAPLVEYAEVAA